MYIRFGGWRGPLRCTSAVLLLLVLQSTVSGAAEDLAVSHETLIPVSKYLENHRIIKKSNRSQKSGSNDDENTPILPYSYSDLGPNVRASGSFKRPSRRIGLAFKPKESNLSEVYTEFPNAKESGADHEPGQGVTSQPDISTDVSTSTKYSISKLSDRITTFQKNFPKFRTRFGSRLKPKESTDLPQEDDEYNLSSRTEPFPRNMDKTPDHEITDGDMSTTKPGSKRPFVVRRPHRNRNQPRDDSDDVGDVVSNEPEIAKEHSGIRSSTNTGFKKPSNRKKYPEEVSVHENQDEQFETNEHHREDSQSQHSSDTFAEFQYPIEGNLSGREQPGWTSINTKGELPGKSPSPKVAFSDSNGKLKSTSFSINRVEYTRHSEVATNNNDDANKRENPHENMQLNGRDEFVHTNSNHDQNNFRVTLEPTNEILVPGNTGHQNRHHPEEYHTVAPIKPSTSDDGREWYPNGPHNSDKEIPTEIGYVQNERESEIHSSASEDHSNYIHENEGLYRGDVNTFTANPSERENHPYFSRKPTHDVSFRNTKGEEDNRQLPNFEIPDLSLAVDNPSNRNAAPLMHRNSNVFNPIPSGYQKFHYRPRNVPKRRQKQKTEWAFDPQWAVSDGSFVNHGPSGTQPFIPTTEKYFNEPTKIPGSPHLIARSEFPYNFWRPGDDKQANDEIHPRSNQNGHSPEFKEVPDFLFSVGTGPVSVPEELVRNTYEMVTAAPSFDIMSNPFESSNREFNSLPNIEEHRMPNIPLSDNAQGFNNRFNRQNRPFPGRNNPLASIMDMISPNPNNRPNGQRPIRPIYIDTNNPPVTPFRVHSSLSPSAAPLQHIPVSHPTALPTHLRPTGFAHFTNQIPRSSDNNVAQHEEQTNFINQENDIYGNEAVEHIPRMEANGLPMRSEQHIRNVRPQVTLRGNQRNMPVLSHVPDRSHLGNRPNQRTIQRFKNNGRPNQAPHHRARMPPPRHHPNEDHKFIVQEPKWINNIAQDLPIIDNSIIRPINPHSKYASTLPPEHGTRSHFDVKHFDLNHARGSHNIEAFSGPNQVSYSNTDSKDQQFQFEVNSEDEQVNQHHFYQPPQRQQIEHYRVRMPLPARPHPHRVIQYRNPNEENRREPTQSIWSALTDFNLSFLNPFSSRTDGKEEVDRVATGATALPTSFLVPGGLAVLGAGLGLFYFNYVWSPTTVVRARLMDMIAKGSGAMTEQQQRAIGDVTKVYSALADLTARYADQEALTDGPDGSPLEPHVSRDCKNRLVCQTYHEFEELLNLTKDAATLLKGTLRHLDQELLLEYFLAADRGHHLHETPSATCQDFYSSCTLPSVSVKNALRDLVGIRYEEPPRNSLDDVTAAQDDKAASRSLNHPDKENKDDETSASAQGSEETISLDNSDSALTNDTSETATDKASADTALAAADSGKAVSEKDQKSIIISDNDRAEVAIGENRSPSSSGDSNASSTSDDNILNITADFNGENRR